MPIDKIIPRFLVSDEDERLLKEGAMTDALNVTISEDGAGSEGVVKTIKGTDPAVLDSGATSLPSGSKVIGQVSDPQRGFIYFFVASDDNTEGIYQYNTKSSSNNGLSANTYRPVANSTIFKFDEDGFVKADLVNGDFARDGSIQTIIYFTDNKNIPRKINVERALNGDYSLVSASTYDFSLSAARAALNTCPVVKFNTDEGITQNDFLNDYFQFATQLLYVDGEESAISPYSILAVPSNVVNNTLETQGQNRIFQNVCVIDPGYKREIVNNNSDGFNVNELAGQPSNGIPDVEFIRLLARRGTTGPFFIVDDLPISSNISRKVYGENRTVWNYVTGEYKFYNDKIKSFIDSSTIDKMYDNVPQKAEGQAIAGNRLFYSNYVEGYPNGDENGDPVKAKISVDYLPTGNTLSTTSSGDIFDEGGNTSNADIVFDITNQVVWPDGSNPTDVVASGSLLSFSCRWNPREMKVKGTTADGIVSINYYNQGQYFVVGLAPSTESYSFPVGWETFNGWMDLNIPISADFQLEEEMTLADIALEFKNLISPQEYTFSYEFNSYLGNVENFYLHVIDPLDSNLSAGDPVLVTQANVNITFAFDDIYDPNTSDGTFVIRPYIKNIIVTDISLHGGGYSSYLPSEYLSDEQIQSVHTMNFNTSPLSQDDQVFSNIANTTSYVSNSLVNVSTEANYSTFKTGCAHDFGIVYYDKWNRSGFVNEIGTAYIKPLSQRASGQEGRAEVKVIMDCNPPTWAAKWQLVYGGMSSFSDYFQYTTGGGYVPTKNALPDENKKEVYVSLKTLDLYRDEKSPGRDYSFTEGDILRVVSYVDNSGNVVFPSSNDPSKQIEFNVVRVEVLGASDNPIQLENNVTDDLKGTFLVLTSPEVTSDIQVLNSNGVTTGLKYDGFDWFSVAEYFGGTQFNYPYPDGTQSSGNNYWGQQCVVEILTPSKSTESKVYYEIGEAHDVWTVADDPEAHNLYSTKHGPPITTRTGDSWQRLVSCKTPILSNPSSNNWDASNGATGDGSIRDIDNWDYVDLELESLQVDDLSYTKDWSKGRPHAVFKEAATNVYKNGLIYGDAYVEGNKKLSYSSFNPSLANFETLEGSFGAIEYIGNYNDDLVALQENKLCLAPVNKNILEYASGSADVAVSTSVVGQRRYASGDYGSSGHPEAVLIQDNSVYFVDESRQAVCSLVGGQLVPISEKNMSSFFENFFNAGHTKYVSGYDPRDNTYYLTGLGSISPTYKTVGYDAARGVWQSRYSFQPDIYSNQNNMLYSAKYADNGNIFWKHNSSSYNSFYGVDYTSSVQVVSKVSPSRVKVFNAISYEGDSNTWEMRQGATTNLNQTSGIINDAAGDQIPKFVEKEGSYYAAIPKDTSTKYIYAGTFSSANGNVISVTDMARIDRYPFLLNETQLQYLSNDVYSGVTYLAAQSTVSSFDLSTNTITVGGGVVAPSAGDKLFFKVDTDGDAMRGNFMTINLATSLSNQLGAKKELYCINVHVTDSKSHHPLGQ